MNTDFYHNVADYVPVRLPRPQRKCIIEDGEEIPIIGITTELWEW